MNNEWYQGNKNFLVCKSIDILSSSFNYSPLKLQRTNTSHLSILSRYNIFWLWVVFSTNLLLFKHMMEMSTFRTLHSGAFAQQDWYQQQRNTSMIIIMIINKWKCSLGKCSTWYNISCWSFVLQNRHIGILVDISHLLCALKINFQCL